MYNRVVLVGNLTRDIELKQINASKKGETGIAVSRKFTASNGEKREETCFIDIAFWGKTAEIAAQYLSKGSKVLVEGRLKYEQWDDANGQKHSKHTVSVENMEMLGSNKNQEKPAAAEKQAAATADESIDEINEQLSDGAALPF